MTELFADERGIWRSDEGKEDLGMAWEAIVAVTLHKIHDGRHVVVVLEFDDADGEIFVITDRIRGFDAVTEAVGMRLEAFTDNLRDALEAETPMDDPRQLWRLVSSDARASH